MTVGNRKKIKSIIHKRFQIELYKFLAAAESVHCKHEWYKYGFGYKCDKCNFYSGTNNTLNKLIESEIC